MQRHQQRLFALLLPVAMGTALHVAGVDGQSAQTGAASTASQRASGNETPTDDLQRSIRLYNYKVVAESGVARGENLYHDKCWFCHNKHVIAINPGSAPYLQDLYKRERLVSGQPVNDDTVATMIKNGASRMPAYGTNLSDSDLADLVSYLRSGKCCLEGEDPPPNPWYRASTSKWSVPTTVSGGPRGVVRTNVGGGDSTEGIKVQLIAPNGVRTTVYANEEGRYEFPKMQPGAYTLRIATPLEFKPYQRDAVRIDGATAIPDIVLERHITFAPLKSRSVPDSLPATRDIEGQLSGAEILWNLPGTAQEKDTFRRGCSNGCHSYQQILRSRYDERSWALIVDRMMNYRPAHLTGRTEWESGKEDEQMIVKWLAKVRGPGGVDAPYHVPPRPVGLSTRVVVTEYELPRTLIRAHDVSGDSKGNIWYTSHRTRFVGRVDPRTGIVTEYAMPVVPGAVPGTHRVLVDQKRGDTVWISTWAGSLAKFDSRTGQMTQTKIPIGGNFGQSPDGFLWGGGLVKVDPVTEKVVQKYDMGGRSTYDNVLSDDGNFWVGGSPPYGGNYAEVLDIRTGKMHFLDTGARMSSPARGGFDPFGNAWFGGRMAALIQIDTKTLKMREHLVPTGYSPYSVFYEAMPDKNGEVWAGVLQGRGFVRYNPRTGRWIEYALPEPYGHDRRTWIDNSTTPVTVWYVDFQGYLVRIQPLE